MKIDLQVRFVIYGNFDNKWKQTVLCFKHAVQEAMTGKDIVVEVDDFDPNYGGSASCEMCEEKDK